MNQECEETRKDLPKYLQGHVFRSRRGRIERHLDQCVICKSEFEALRRTEETRQLLRDINSSGGVVGRVRDGVFALGKIRKLLYRPIWIAVILLAAAALVYYLVTPHQLAREIDSIVKSEPTPSTPAASPDVPAAPPNVSRPEAPPAPAHATKPDASAHVTRPSATAVQPLPAASAAKPKKTPRPEKSPSIPQPAQQLVTAPSETAVPAAGQQLPPASAAKPKKTPRPEKSPSAPRSEQQLATTPSVTAEPASPPPGPSQ